MNRMGLWYNPKLNKFGFEQEGIDLHSKFVHYFIKATRSINGVLTYEDEREEFWYPRNTKILVEADHWRLQHEKFYKPFEDAGYVYIGEIQGSE
jgi:hypothetical protein